MFLCEFFMLSSHTRVAFQYDLKEKNNLAAPQGIVVYKLTRQRIQNGPLPHRLNNNINPLTTRRPRDN